MKELSSQGAGGASESTMWVTGFSSSEAPALNIQLRRPPLCRLSVVLRAMALVFGGAAFGLAWSAQSFADWSMAFAAACGLAMPALLGWLACCCPLFALLDRWRWRRAWQMLSGWALGACAGAGVWALEQALQLGLMSHAHGGLAALWGGLCAGVLLHWLSLLGEAQTPADTAARLAELQARIRPHFLFNTLNTALGLVRTDPERAEQVLEDLSDLFRAALDESGAAVSLAQEVELARRYLDIEQARFGQRLAVIWDLDEAAAGARLPPLFLQPLVENAVRHGVEPGDEGGWVRIRTRRKGSRVNLWVINSLSSKPSQPGHGLALDNLQRRLGLLHDLRARFEAVPQPGLFRVHVSIPFDA